MHLSNARVFNKAWLCDHILPTLLSFQHAEKAKRDRFDELKVNLLNELIRKEYLPQDVVDQYQSQIEQLRKKSKESIAHIDDAVVIEDETQKETLEQKITEATETFRQRLQKVLHVLRTRNAHDSELSRAIDAALSLIREKARDVNRLLHSAEESNEKISIRLRWLTEEILNTIYQALDHMLKQNDQVPSYKGIALESLQPSQYETIKKIYLNTVEALFASIVDHLEPSITFLMRDNPEDKTCQIRFYFLSVLFVLMCSHVQKRQSESASYEAMGTPPLFEMCERLMANFYPKSFRHALLFANFTFHFVDMCYTFHSLVHLYEFDVSPPRDAVSFIPVVMLNKMLWIVNRYQNYRFFTDDQQRIAHVSDPTISYTPLLFTPATQSLPCTQQTEVQMIDHVDHLLLNFDTLFGHNSKHPASHIIHHLQVMNMNEWMKCEMMLSHNNQLDTETHVRIEYYRNNLQREYLSNECNGSIRALIENILASLIDYTIECCTLEKTLQSADIMLSNNTAVRGFKTILVDMSVTLGEGRLRSTDDDELHVWIPDVLTCRLFHKGEDEKINLQIEASVAQFALHHFFSIIGSMYSTVILTGGYHVDFTSEEAYFTTLKFATYLIHMCGCLYPWSLSFVTAILKAIVSLTCSFLHHSEDTSTISSTLGSFLESVPLFTVSIMRNWTYYDMIITNTINYEFSAGTKQDSLSKPTHDMFTRAIREPISAVISCLKGLFDTKSNDIYEEFVYHVRETPITSALALFDAAIYLAGSSMVLDRRSIISKSVSSLPWNDFEKLDKDFVIARVIGQLEEINRIRQRNDVDCANTSAFLITFFDTCLQYHAVTSNWDENVNNQISSNGRIDVLTVFTSAYKSTVLKILEHWAGTILAMFPEVTLIYRPVISRIVPQDQSNWGLLSILSSNSEEKKDVNVYHLCEGLQVVYKNIENFPRHELSLYNALSASKQRLHVSVAWLRFVLAMSPQWVDRLFTQRMPLWKETLDATLLFLKNVAQGKELSGLSGAISIMLYKNMLNWWSKVVNRVGRSAIGEMTFELDQVKMEE
jgi:hypothetical protein